ncbi:uncharacterized protein EV420DRAFT_156630 [Desarmillaria tabescens]|uniref:Secreted protein n=1 Tax=Armillaria tabescens TaxID=1929756 RepID=A0AA39ML63_ARMTA|nr:uncharacterized protein EV420DRAFT_156630 [Desarmillaria tabescens]KAK0437764.1 hypothetical protein EV420DRAFT_156630 [Desarmillaria tabescens]
MLPGTMTLVLLSISFLSTIHLNEPQSGSYILHNRVYLKCNVYRTTSHSSVVTRRGLLRCCHREKSWPDVAGA